MQIARLAVEPDAAQCSTPCDEVRSDSKQLMELDSRCGNNEYFKASKWANENYFLIKFEPRLQMVLNQFSKSLCGWTLTCQS